jgi:hypothetical protein
MMADFATDLFTGLIADAQATAEKLNDLSARATAVYAYMPSLESLYQVTPLDRFHANQRVQYAASGAQQSQHITSATFPASLKAVYVAECAEPPKLSVFDAHMPNGQKALRLYTDPEFFIEQWVQEQIKLQKEAKKARKERRAKMKGAKETAADPAAQIKKKPAKLERVRYDPVTGEKITTRIQASAQGAAAQRPPQTQLIHAVETMAVPLETHIAAPRAHVPTLAVPAAAPASRSLASTAAQDSSVDFSAIEVSESDSEDNGGGGGGGGGQHSLAASTTSAADAGDDSPPPEPASAAPSGTPNLPPPPKPMSSPGSLPPPMPSGAESHKTDDKSGKKAKDEKKKSKTPRDDKKDKKKGRTPRGDAPPVPGSAPPPLPSSAPPPATSTANAVPISAPLPPPPPPMPSSVGAAPPPMPGKPLGGGHGGHGGDGGGGAAPPRGGLLDQIAKGAQLKKVEPVEKPAPTDGRSSLLTAITSGVQLKQAQNRQLPDKKPKDDGPLSVADILARRIAIVGNDDKDDSDSDGWDQDWD